MLSTCPWPIQTDLLKKSSLLLEPSHPTFSRSPQPGLGRRIHPSDRTLLLRRIPLLGRQGPLPPPSTALLPLLAGTRTASSFRDLRLFETTSQSRTGRSLDPRRNRTPQRRHRHLQIQHRLRPLQMGETILPHRRRLRRPTSRRPLSDRLLSHSPNGRWFPARPTANPLPRR